MQASHDTWNDYCEHDDKSVQPRRCYEKTSRTYTKNFSNKIIHKIRPSAECGTFLTDFLKYGEENFDIEIISPNLTEEEAQILKTYYIGKYQTGYPDGYNDGLEMLNGYELLTYTEQKFHRFTSKCYNGDDTPYQKYMKISEQMKRRDRRHE